jgi:segregation and condensation protein B
MDDGPSAKRRIEAVLLLARDPITLRKLAELADLADATEARTLVRHLNEQYVAAGRAFRIEEVAGGFQLLTVPRIAPWLRRLSHLPTALRLTPPVLETLAIVAYRQPVLRSEIESIRGVTCGEILRQLMDRDLVRIDGRSEELGRPYLYGTTKQFLQLCGLKHLSALPHPDWMNPSKLADSPVHVSPVPVSSFPHNADPRNLDKESPVTAALAIAVPAADLDAEAPLPGTGTSIIYKSGSSPRAAKDEEEEEEEDEYFDDDEDDDDEEEEFEDEEDDFEDDEEEFEEEEEGEDGEDLEEEEWEEVDDEDEEWDEEEEDDEEDWDDEEGDAAGGDAEGDEEGDEDEEEDEEEWE